MATPLKLSVGGTLSTLTATVLPALYVPSSSVALAEIVWLFRPSAYVCVTDAGLPLTVCTLPSPQVISQALIVSGPGSLDVRFSVYADPR